MQEVKINVLGLQLLELLVEEFVKIIRGLDLPAG
jgi:hypothetical protein